MMTLFTYWAEKRIDEDPESVLVEDQIVLGGLVFDEQGILEPAAAAWLDPDAKSPFSGGNLLRFDKLLDFHPSGWGDVHCDFWLC